MTTPESTETILVVDDEAELLTAVTKVLTRAGYAVTAASKGREAVRLMRERRFSVVVTDMLIPDVDGAEIIAASRRFQPAARIVAISGGGIYMGPTDTLMLAGKLGAGKRLAKPFTPAQLLEAVGYQTGSPAAA